MRRYELTCLMLFVASALVGCGTTASSTQACDTCRQADVTDTAPTFEQSFMTELSRGRVRNAELESRLTDLQSERDVLRDRVARLQQEREITQTSVMNASHQVGVTRKELDETAADIRTIRNELRSLIEDVASLDAAHTNQIDRFSRRLDDLVQEYDAGASPLPSRPLDLRARSHRHR